MNSSYLDMKAGDDFNKARSKEFFTRILHLMRPKDQDMLSLKDVRSLLKPRSESYRGMQVVEISHIIGSEGRYRDFNKWFLPKHDHMRNRWVRVDKAHLTQVILPPIKLYEIGGAYFVRDGNHRVSVARSQGVLSIDAEVVSLGSEIKLEPGMTKDDLKARVIEYERQNFYDETAFDKIVGDEDLIFTATGRYDEIINHIYGHKYYINENIKGEIPFEEAMVSWYNNVYRPIVDTIRDEKILIRFPGRTYADLYVWIVKHWDELKRKYGSSLTVKDAAKDFSSRYGKSIWQQLNDIFSHLLGRRP